MAEFKPCPFCGNTEFEVTSENDFYGLQRKNDRASISVRCWPCNMEYWEHSWGERDYDKRVQMLADKWNRRVNK